MVALMRRDFAERVADGRASELPTWGELLGLCMGESFADQPAAAFCSGVLVDHDLVLTSEHCVSMSPITDSVVVFDYLYESQGSIDVDYGALFDVERVVAVGVFDDGAAQRLDFAFIRLSRPVTGKRRPAALYTQRPELSVGQAIFSASTGGGVPMKWDASATIQALRVEGDYFIANTDTSEGASGSAALDETLGLVGVLSRGGADFEPTPEGCLKTAALTDAPQEQFTQVHQAVAELCRVEPERWMCDADCRQPCSISRDRRVEAQCSLVLGPGDPRARLPTSPLALLLAWLLTRVRLRWTRRSFERIHFSDHQ